MTLKNDLRQDEGSCYTIELTQETGRTSLDLRDSQSKINLMKNCAFSY